MTNTQLTQMALSAILRCKEQIDIFDLCYVLRGRSTQQIKQNEFDKIKTFGAGKAYSRHQWLHMFIQMIQQDFIDIDYKDLYHLKVTQKGHDVLKGKMEVANLTIGCLTKASRFYNLQNEYRSKRYNIESVRKD